MYLVYKMWTKKIIDHWFWTKFFLIALLYRINFITWLFFFFPAGFIYNECNFFLNSETPYITKGERRWYIPIYLFTYTYAYRYFLVAHIYSSPNIYSRAKQGERYLSRLLSSAPKLTQDLYHTCVRPLLQDRTL